MMKLDAITKRGSDGERTACWRQSTGTIRRRR
jgi:hypothetical protein